jgi:hypothetical protein
MRTKDDIDLRKIDISKHTFILKPGEKIYRTTIGTYALDIPTGQENRNAKNPNNLSIEQFQEKCRQGLGSVAGTGNYFYSIASSTAKMEVEKNYGAEAMKSAHAHYALILKPISCIDTISICESEGVDPTPDPDQKKEKFFHLFYGKPYCAQALKQKSAVDPNGINIVFYPDNIPDFENSIRRIPIV